MRVDKSFLASLGLLIALSVLSPGCKPKLGGKCSSGQSFCTKDGALFCGDDGKLAAMGCHGPKGCVSHGKAASCDKSLGVAGEGCEDTDNIACSVDKKSELDCKDHTWVVGATCKGTKGCELKGDELFCDYTTADKDDPCHRDGQYACTTDKASILKCEGSVMHPIETCRGPGGCTSEDQPAKQTINFSCDDSIAQEGDPCDSEGVLACAMDKKSIHICKDKKFVSHKACTGPKGCTVDTVAQKLLCDTGKGGIFSGAGGGAKISSAAGGAGTGAKAKTGAAGSASAKPAASASGKPAGSASAAFPSASAPASASAAGSASAKPGASASAGPTSSAKPAASTKALTTKKKKTE